MADQLPGAPAPREKRINLRLDAELFQAAVAMARQLGGISVVIRVLLRKFVAGEVKIRREDVVDELLPAPPQPRPPRRGGR